LIIAEKQKPVLQTLDIDQLTYKQVFYIGMAQCLSLWPGFSRSGATIAGGMLAGATRGAAAEFSFLIAVPVMIIATSYEMLQSYHLFSGNDFYFLATGFVVSFIVALIAVVTFIKLVQKLSLIYFAYYRFALALVFLFYILVSGS
jgi:undecaprenyl-diphosphatase